MAQVHEVRKARKAIPEAGIAVGDRYYWWKFRFSGKRVSKTYPRPSELTQSEFLSTFLAAQETFADETEKATSREDFESAVETMKTELEQLRDECQEKLDNMPDSLRESSSSGELLQARVDNLDEYVNNLDNIEYDELDEESADETEKEAALDNIRGEIEGADPGVE